MHPTAVIFGYYAKVRALQGCRRLYTACRWWQQFVIIRAFILGYFLVALFYKANKTKKKPANANRLVTLDIARFNHDGQGIGYVDDKICFVDGALPGERVKARVSEDKSRFIKAVTTEVISAGPGRITPACRHFALCGGCQLQYAGETVQQQLKREAVNDLFKRFADSEQLPWQADLNAQPWHYRRAARIGVWYEAKNGGFVVGFRRANSKEITAIDDCAVLVTAFARVFAAFAAVLPQLGAGRAVTHLEVVQADNANVVVIRHTRPFNQADKGKLAQLATDYGYLLLSEYDKGRFECLSTRSLPSLYYQLPQWDIRLEFAVGDFIQVNSAVNQQMIAQAIDWLDIKKTDVVLDLFCGIGNFSLPLARLCAQVVGIEGVDEMVARATHNAALNNLDNCSFYQADLSASGPLDSGPYRQFDKILLDPARAGAAALMDGLKDHRSEKVLYVSCEPLTLARDSAVLLRCGYRLTKIALIDMFSQTRRVEVMALFES